MTPDETTACWAALADLVDDNHQPARRLTDAQWSAAETLLAELDRKQWNVLDDVNLDAADHYPTEKDTVLLIALARMVLDAADALRTDRHRQVAVKLRDRYDQLAHQTAAA